MSHRNLLALSLLTLIVSIQPAAAVTGPDSALLITCAACHGSRGEGNTVLGGPPLAGQRSEYLARQLRAFKAGQRGTHPDDTHGATMRGVAAGLNDAAIESLATHFAQQPSAPTSSTVSGDPTAGKSLYDGTCAACHGPQAQGYSQLQSPNLKVLGSDYLIRQMTSYVRGWRGEGSKAELPAVWMHSIANQIVDPTALANVGAYLRSLATP